MTLMTPSPTLVRDARPDEAAALTELAMRSKAWWGYAPAFMERCRATLTVTEVQIRSRHVRVLDAGAAPAGFHALRPLEEGRVELDLLFVDPPFIGRGVGARLLADAVEIARGLEFASMMIESDPFAEPFYRRHGARRVGWVDSSAEAGRRLPLLELDLASFAG